MFVVCVFGNKYLGGKYMKIAVTYNEGKIFNHFGNCENFKFYNVVDGKVVSVELINIEPKGQKYGAEFLAGQDITHLICGGLGSEARETLDSLNIEYFPKVKVDADVAVENFIKGELDYSLDRGCCGKSTKDGCGCSCKK